MAERRDHFASLLSLEDGIRDMARRARVLDYVVSEWNGASSEGLSSEDGCVLSMLARDLHDGAKALVEEFDRSFENRAPGTGDGGHS